MIGMLLSFFTSTTFKRHLNIYLNFAYDFCLPVSDGRKMIFHTQIDFELTHSRQMPPKDRLQIFNQSYIYPKSLSKNKKK